MNDTRPNQSNLTISPLVSIVVVAYNNWPDLELAIQSALSQTYQWIEVIVVDNSSTDETPDEVALRFGGRVRYIRQPNTGDSGAYNTGMRLATGEFIQFLDGDDVLSPYKIQKQVAIFQSVTEVDVVYGDTRVFQAQPGIAEYVDTERGSQEDLLATFLSSGGEYLGNPVGQLWRRAALGKIGSWDENVYDTDSDYQLRALWAGHRFSYCPESLMGFVRVGPGKMSSNVERLLLGREALWTKALTFVTSEPYRTMVLRNLARVRCYLAIRLEGCSVRRAIAKLFEARATYPTMVPLSICVLGSAALLMPGGWALVRSSRFRWLRRAVASWAGFSIVQ